MTDSIVFTDVSKKYPQVKDKFAVKNFSLRISTGEFFCLVGPSGCGKTTLLKLIVGLEKATSGTIVKPDNISMVFQSGALLPWLTASENIGFGLKMKNIQRKKIANLVEQYLEIVKMANFKNKYPRELSGGQRQRIGLARALSVEPEVLLLDEPFSALDEITTKKLHQDIINIWRQTKITIVMVSHLFEEAALLSDRVGVMVDGGLKGIVDINFARPRQKLSKLFTEKVFEIEKLFS